METPNKSKIAWAIVVVVLVAVSLVFGVKYPLPPEPTGAGPVIESRAAGNLETLRALRVENYFENNGTLTQAGAATFTGPLQGGSPLVMEGATDNAYETTLAVTDPTADRTVTLPNLSGTALLTNTPGVTVFGTNVITGTGTIAHGLTTPQTVLCVLAQDSEANAATCSYVISGATVTLKVWKADGVTAGSVAKQVGWIVAGQP